MRSLKMPEGEAIEARMVTRSIENAQRKVEARNFDIRKQLLEYDDVANDQRKVIYHAEERAARGARDLRHDRLDPPRRARVHGQRIRPARQRRGAVGHARPRAQARESDYFIKAPVAKWAAEDTEIDGADDRGEGHRARGGRIRTRSSRPSRTGRSFATTSAR